MLPKNRWFWVLDNCVQICLEGAPYASETTNHLLVLVSKREPGRSKIDIKKWEPTNEEA